jgi:hypothetical protein
MFRQRILELVTQWAPYAAKQRVNKYNPVHKFVCDDIPAALEAWSPTASKYKFKGSDGQGNILAAPWFAVFNKEVTTRASEGYYLVYLLSEDLQSLVLEIGFGATQFERKFGRGKPFFEEVAKAVAHMRNSSQYLLPKALDVTLEKTNIQPVVLAASNEFNLRAYESCTIYSISYSVENLPVDEELKAHYLEYLRLYEMMVDSLLLGDVDDYIVDALDASELPAEIVVKQFMPRPPKKTPRGDASSSSGGRRYSKKSDKIGRLGEEWVFEFEKERLRKAGLEHLAEKVILHRNSATDRTPGWDITSVETDGTARLIEVKSSEGDTINDVILTKQEWDKASDPKRASRFYIYIVTNIVGGKPQLEILSNPWGYVQSKQLAITVESYCLSLRLSGKIAPASLTGPQIMYQ